MDSFARQATASLRKQQRITNPQLTANEPEEESTRSTHDAEPPMYDETVEDCGPSVPPGSQPGAAEGDGGGSEGSLSTDTRSVETLELVDECEEMEVVTDMVERPTVPLTTAGFKSYISCLKQRLGDLSRQYTGGPRPAPPRRMCTRTRIHAHINPPPRFRLVSPRCHRNHCYNSSIPVFHCRSASRLLIPPNPFFSGMACLPPMPPCLTLQESTRGAPRSPRPSWPRRRRVFCADSCARLINGSRGT